MADPALESTPPFLAGGGEIGALMRDHDWAATSLGSPSSWPQTLRTIIGVCLNSPMLGAVLWGPELLFLYNDAYTPSLAERHPGALGRPVAEVWGSAWDQVSAQFLHALATGEAFSEKRVELLISRRGRLETTYWDFTVAPIRGDDGSIVGLFNQGVEITESVQAERRLTDERERLARLFEQAPSFMAMLEGQDHRVTLTNPAYARLIGHRQILGKTIAEALPDAVAQGYLDLLDEVFRSGQAFSATGSNYAMQLDAGGPVVERFVDVVFQPIVDAQDRVTGIFIEGVDVTARTLADAALRESEAELNRMFEEMSEAFILFGPDFTIRRINDAGVRIDGRPREALVGRHLLEVWPEAAELPTWPLYQKVLAEQRGAELTYRHRSDMHDLWIEVRAYPSGDGIVSFYRDVTEAVRAVEALRESEEQFRVFATTVPNHVWAARPDGYLYWFNEQVYAYSGDEPGSLCGVVEWTRIVHPDDLAEAGLHWQASLETGDVYEAEFRIRRADGHYRWYLVRAAPVRAADGSILRWVGTNTDIDDAKRQAGDLALLNATLEQQVVARTRELMIAEEALRQSQKMEAVGQLTGGLAHDFNNLLTGITGSLELLQARIMQGRLGDADRYVTAAQGAAKRAAALTHRLLAFSRRQTLDPKPTDVNRLVAGMEDLVRRTVGPAIAVEAVASGGLWSTMIDPGQLENALLNLCINGRDAMPDGGRLTIETGNRWLDERSARDRDMAAGQYVSLCVSDNGAGMSPEVIARAFDPFFTTKPIGMGTGLGLSMIYGFVRQSGGQARIYSEVGQGTVVCLYLPRHMGEADLAEDTADQPKAARGRSGETVLIVDDEPTVRMLVTDVLEDLGYIAIEAADGAAGLRVLQSSVRVDLLVTDVGLPGGMNGRQVADAARVLRPDLKVLFITGYAENAVLNHGHLDAGMHLMTKPFAMETLAIRVRALIQGHESSSVRQPEAASPSSSS